MNENQPQSRTLKVEISDVPDLIKVCMDSKNNLLIVGCPGTGKSTVIKGMENEGYKVTMLTGSSTYEETVNGIPYRDSTKKSVAGNDISVYNVPSWLEDVANYKDKQILFIDEFNTADPQVLKTFLSILTDRKVPTQSDTLAIPDNCVIVAAMNPADQNDGEQLIRPLKSRFMTVEILSTLVGFQKYIINNHSCKNLDNDTVEALVSQLNKDNWGQEGKYSELNPRSFTNFLHALDSVCDKDDLARTSNACSRYSVAFFGQMLSFPLPADIEETKRQAKIAKNPFPTIDELEKMTDEELNNVYKTMSVKMTTKADKICVQINNILATRKSN